MAHIVDWTIPKYKLNKSTSTIIKRVNPIPLDGTEIFSTLSEAEIYAKTDPVAIVGQAISVTELSNDKTTYSTDRYVITYELNENNSYLSPVLLGGHVWEEYTAPTTE